MKGYRVHIHSDPLSRKGESDRSWVLWSLTLESKGFVFIDLEVQRLCGY